MNRVLTISLSVLSLAWVACDKISNPLPKKDASATALVDTTKTVTKTNTNNTFRKVLIEDYTGHKCGNCPQAATEAENIKNTMGDSALVLAVHAGFFAKTDANYPTNYTTNAGNDWDASTGFGVGLAGNPNGMVNRMNYPSNHIKGYTTWKNLAQQEVKKLMMVKIDLTTKYDSTSKGINAYVKTTFLQSLSGSYFLNIVYFEDGIVGKQKFYTPAKDSAGYIFNHVLRGDLNGSWGESIATNPVAGAIVSKTYLNNALPSIVNDKKTHVLVFVYNNTSKEIIQAEEVKIR